jgi:hypothetical protein|tara:strand:- start:33 stop:383 length:351 start_codon:yes stop_codon:yes gene_type:complete
MSLQNNIRDLIHFYVKTNYEKYLSEKSIKIIPDPEIDNIIHSLYDNRKSHIQEFILESLKTLYKDKSEEYPGDRNIKNILLNIFQDDDLCKNRLSCEIKLHQQKMRGEKSDYSKIF